MYFFLVILNLVPSLLVLVSYFYIDLELFPILLLLLKVYDSRVESEDLSRIEHKLDSLFSTLDVTADKSTNYERLHRTAWDHPLPIELDEATIILGKKRGDIITAVGLANGAVFYVMGAVWLYSVFNT